MRASQCREIEHRCHLLSVRAGRRLQFGSDFIAAHLVQLVDRPQDLNRLAGQPGRFQQAIENPPVVDPNREPFDAQSQQQIMDDEDGFDVDGQTRAADRVEVALHEFAVPAPLLPLATKHVADVVPLEWNSQLRHVLRHESGERDGQVETQSDFSLTVVDEPVQLLVGLGAPLAEQNLQILDRRRLDRAESVPPVDSSNRFEQLLARNHGLG